MTGSRLEPGGESPAHAVVPAVLLLEQGAAFVESLSDALYTAPVLGPRSGTIGAQVRHVTDFYACLLRDLPRLHIDYDRRERDPLVERQRPCGSARLRQLANALGPLRFRDTSEPLWVRGDEDGRAGGAVDWDRSSLGREIGFLVSHTVHHYALVGLMARTLGHDVPAEFGVASSTLAYWRREPCARSAG